jgi:hypothetical protein
MREFLVIATSSLMGALVLGALAAGVSTFTFYDYLFGPGHTDHERGIAWSIVGASTIIAAGLVLVIGALYWLIKLCYRGATGSPRAP